MRQGLSSDQWGGSALGAEGEAGRRRRRSGWPVGKRRRRRRRRRKKKKKEEEEEEEEERRRRRRRRRRRKSPLSERLRVHVHGPREPREEATRTTRTKEAEEEEEEGGHGAGGPEAAAAAARLLKEEEEEEEEEEEAPPPGRPPTPRPSPLPPHRPQAGGRAGGKAGGGGAGVVLTGAPALARPPGLVSGTPRDRIQSFFGDTCLLDFICVLLTAPFSYGIASREGEKIVLEECEHFLASQTAHVPLIIAGCPFEKLLLFSANEQGRTEFVKELDLKTEYGLFRIVAGSSLALHVYDDEKE
ncbi:hypothetical protein JRQ81_006452 [Phrynocephalus forsythii]|uniref:Uncharacterized protein n=1 Tax=Phrynocephalus forsythii TaxID=171643 RepID=A0A9Q0XGS3_9SAUR|nr:hypothetical protein JRQ81_006452 [Phrynocephalus forsythii]